MEGPSRAATCSVARRIQSASTAIATSPARKTHAGDAPTRYSRKGVTGVTISNVPGIARRRNLDIATLSGSSW